MPHPTEAPRVPARQMSLAVALDFADNPRHFPSLQAPADTMEELREALTVLAAAYRSGMQAPRAPAMERAKKWADYFETATADYIAIAITVPEQRKEIVALLRILAALPAHGEAESVAFWSHEPNIGAQTNEPHLKEVLYRYYRAHFTDKTAHQNANAYIEAMPIPAAPKPDVPPGACARIMAGLEDAAAGNFASVTIDGQTWVKAAPAAPDRDAVLDRAALIVAGKSTAVNSKFFDGIPPKIADLMAGMIAERDLEMAEEIRALKGQNP